MAGLAPTQMKRRKWIVEIVAQAFLTRSIFILTLIKAIVHAFLIKTNVVWIPKARVIMHIAL